MELLDITTSHEDHPAFRERLAKLETVAEDVERRIKRLCILCQQRQQAAKKEQQYTQELIREFEGFSVNDGSTEGSNAAASVDVITTALNQLVDNQERMFEQINLGIVQPLQHFLSNDLEHIKASKKNYKKARTEVNQISERFYQCKKYEMGLMTEMSVHLFEARYELHKTACNYAMDLNLLQAKRVPDFIQRVVDYMTSQLSYFHLGHVTVKDTEQQISSLYSTLDKLRREAVANDASQREVARGLLEEVAITRAKRLVQLQSTDLQVTTESAQATVSSLVSRLVASGADLSNTTTSEDSSKPTTPALTKHGYLCFAEHKTFGTSWVRLYFSIENGKFISLEPKIKVPISLNLYLCSVKLADPVDTERSFCFKVISPTRTLLLQAEGSQGLSEWTTVLTDAITHALNRSSLTPERETVRGPGDESPMPVKPPRPKKKINVLREISSVPGNDVCADCGAPTPKWASVNLGVVVCIECSGVHRSLGVYISQARSLTLDTLKPDWVERLKQIGNKLSNEIYERELGSDFDRAGLKKSEARSKFITDKYKNLLYVSTADRERISGERAEARVESLRKSGVSVEKIKETQDNDDEWVNIDPRTLPTHDSLALSPDPSLVSPDPDDAASPSCDNGGVSRDPDDEEKESCDLTVEQNEDRTSEQQ